MSSFSHIVITAPNERSATLYERELQKLRRGAHELSACQFFAVSDPEGQRLGSGGGTLHVLRVLREKYQVQQGDIGALLIVHSGGESRRAPLYSSYGKAWAAFPASCFGAVASPLALLLRTLSSFFWPKLPGGSVAVCCSDVLLQL
ncbi:hypothetical protein EON64_20990, partial [archaeon]